jgi:Transposase DDE domain/Domain of unknown function (DUF4372)
LILIEIPTFANVTGSLELNAVPAKPSVFASILKLFPWEEFNRAVKTCNAKGARAYTYRSQLVAMLYAQLAGTPSVPALVTEMASHADRFAPLGVQVPAESTLREANRYRCIEVFTEALAVLIARAQPKLRAQMAGVTLLIDSTSLMLNGLSRRWARFSETVCGAKLHIVYDPDAACPVYASISKAKVNDITAAQALPITPGATYVFDLGYYHFDWWAKLDAAGCRIVTRLKKNTPLTVIEERAVAGGAVLSDRIGYLPQRLAGSRQQPMDQPVREVRIRLETGKELRIFTNDLTASAQEIADLYKRRWAIELFFRWIKQVLKIRTFMGYSENAVRLQLIVALIAFLLLRLSQRLQATIASPLTWARLVATNLVLRRGLGELEGPVMRRRATADRKRRLL